MNDHLVKQVSSHLKLAA